MMCIENLELEKNLPKYLERDIEALKKGVKENVNYIDCLVNEMQGSINTAWVNGQITEEQCDYLYKRYVRFYSECKKGE